MSVTVSRTSAEATTTEETDTITTKTKEAAKRKPFFAIFARVFMLSLRSS